MLLDDEVNFKSFIGAIDETSKKSELIIKLKDIKVKKLMLAGKLDKLFPQENLEVEAIRSGSDFAVVEAAGHFLNFERPELISNLIKSYLN